MALWDALVILSGPWYFQIVIILILFSRILNDSISFVTISDDKETTMFLKLRALAIQTPLSDEKIDE